jgi:hypothetical protein
MLLFAFLAGAALLGSSAFGDTAKANKTTDNVENAREGTIQPPSAEVSVQPSGYQDNPLAVLYNNGPLSTGTTTKSGVTAPTGFTWSEVQNSAGDTTSSNTTSGFSGGQASATAFFRLADDFTVPTGQTWTLDSIAFYAYQSGGTNLPFAQCNLRIWVGRPGDPGSVVVFGDTTTNRLSTTGSAAMYRIFNTKYPPPGTVQGTTRLLQYLNVKIVPALQLPEGSYWLDWSTVLQIQAAHFAPSATIIGRRGLANWNGRQFITTFVWQDALDAGNPTTAPDSVQDFPFILYGRGGGTAVGEGSGIPTEFSLKQNFPNPFNPTTIIQFSVPEAADVTLTVHNMLGQEVARLVDDRRNAGSFNVGWDGTNKTGMPVASGTYFYRMVAKSASGIHTNIKKMLLVK